jgi:NAD+ kinase
MTKIELEDHRRFSGDQVAPNLSLDGIKVLDEDVAAEDVELAMVLGGDGTILKAAEIVRDAQTPLLGINLGHVGFLAESERDGLTDAVRRVVERDYVVKQRLALDVTVFVEGKEAFKTWALNEAAIEKNAREKMLEVVLEIDRRPLSSFGCDGVVVATPTGSTAYSFSAGGPVVWTSVEALLVVPLSAHALFARPLVVSPKSMIAVEIMERSAGSGVLWCDGRRTWELPPGARVEIKRSTVPVRLARFRQGVFTDRLVRKFSLPVVGWRGHEGGEQS